MSEVAAAREVLFNGMSISMLAQVFGKDSRDVAKRLTPLKPCGERDGFPVYNLAEAARYIVEPIVDMEAYLQSLKPSDLPTAVQKAYWDGQNARLKYEENARQLWRTEKVLEVFVDVFKKLRSTLVMFEDTVDDAVGLNEAQRKTVRGLADQLLTDLRVGLVDEFQVNGQTNELKSYEDET